jgi:hypothetical protein
MKLLIVFTISGILLFQSCVFSQEREQSVTCWLSVEYIKCLNNYLPCECEKAVKTYFSINIDTSLTADLHRIALLKHEQMESYYYRLKKDSINKYDILKSDNITEKLGAIFFNKDTLRLCENGIISKYVQTGTCDRLDNNSHLTDNVKLLNSAFVDKGYPTLNEILSHDKLLCACNKWIGRLNLLSINGRSDSWILEQTKDSLFIYKVINIEADPDDPIIKEKIYEYKW